MTVKAKRYLYSTRPLAFLAMALIMLPAVASVAHGDGENDVNPAARSAASGEAIRTAPANQGRQRLTEERAMVNALAGKRDPFKVPPPPKIDGGGDDMDGPLPPGVRGLVIGQLRLKGIVRDEESKTMIAVVTNRANLAYFLHIHEDVYNGVVTRITSDAIYFQQRRLDSGGRIDAREVVLRLGFARQEAR